MGSIHFVGMDFSPSINDASIKEPSARCMCFCFVKQKQSSIHIGFLRRCRVTSWAVRNDEFGETCYCVLTTATCNSITCNSFTTLGTCNSITCNSKLLTLDPRNFLLTFTPSINVPFLRNSAV